MLSLSVIHQATAKQKQGKSPSEHLPAAVANGRKDGPTGKATGKPKLTTCVETIGYHRETV